MLKNCKLFIFTNPVLILLSLSMVSCVPVISKHVVDQVKPNVTFKEVLHDPERFKDQIILVSGVIVESKNTQQGTLLTVSQRPMGFRGKPKDVDESDGRFLALDSRYLEVEIFTQGRSVTIAGEVVGKKVQPLGEIEYTYPFVHIKEIYLWPVEKKYNTYPYYYDHLWWQGYYLYY